MLPGARMSLKASLEAGARLSMRRAPHSPESFPGRFAGRAAKKLAAGYVAIMADADLEQAARKWIPGEGPAPVRLWNPSVRRDIGLRIDSEGRWLHEGREIARPKTVKLFAALLRKDPDGHFLVTPVEMSPVEVADAPFVVRDMRVEGEGVGRRIVMRTNLDEEIVVGPEHGLRFETGAAEGLKPYVRVRDDLWARVSRALAVALAEAGEVREVEGRTLFGVASGGAFFPMADAGALEPSP